MNPNQATLDFIHAHQGEDPLSLSLRFARKAPENVDIPLALMQIDARRKALSKLPWLVCTPSFIFPDTLSAEQCTAWPVALYHASVAGVPDSVLDITCGLGVDLMAVASGAARVRGCDISPTHVDCLRHNLKARGMGAFRIDCADARSLLMGLADHERFDIVFADPARRSGSGARTYALADCSPDITGLLPLIRRHADRLLLKVSPMLDVKMLTSQLPMATHVHAVSLRGECKELLVDCDFKSAGVPRSYSAANINAAGEVSVFTFYGDSAAAPVPLAADADLQSGAWLFEPHASMMKFIHMAPLAGRCPMLRKLAANTHLFLGKGDVPCGLPGRVLRIMEVWPSYRHCAGKLPAHLNVVTRNFPDSPEQVRKKLKIRDGGTDFLYCCRMDDKRMRLLLCRLA